MEKPILVEMRAHERPWVSPPRGRGKSRDQGAFQTFSPEKSQVTRYTFSNGIAADSGPLRKASVWISDLVTGPANFLGRA